MVSRIERVPIFTRRRLAAALLILDAGPLPPICISGEKGSVLAGSTGGNLVSFQRRQCSGQPAPSPHEDRQQARLSLAQPLPTLLGDEPAFAANTVQTRRGSGATTQRGRHMERLPTASVCCGCPPIPDPTSALGSKPHLPLILRQLRQDLTFESPRRRLFLQGGVSCAVR